MAIWKSTTTSSNALRVVALGCTNFLFAGSNAGGEPAANL
tara:strand:+ start:326 stop:445 length:120 start_codon:yes stop_codon:yes gene_type:complete